MFFCYILCVISLLSSPLLASHEKYNDEDSKIENSIGALLSPLLDRQALEEDCSNLPIRELTDSNANQHDQIHVTVVIDAFRAFATAAYVLEHNPATYMLATKCSVITRLAANYPNPLLIGKPEIGSELAYDIPNSPTRVQSANVTNRHVFHRTAAGAKGVLEAQDADIVLAAGFGNAGATAKYIRALRNPKVTIIPMGHEATTPSLEDEICAQYIDALLKGKQMNLAPFLSALREGPGQYFFSDDQWQYPREDFERCLEIGCFNFAIRAFVQKDYAILTRCN